MPCRILADENVDRRVVPRLEADGHNVVHVDESDLLEKGTDDRSIAACSLENDRLVLTSDDDFLREFDEAAYAGLLFVEDDSLTYREIGEAVTAIASMIPQENVETVYVTRSWL